MAKQKTNEQAFRAFIKNADPILLGVIRGMMLSRADQVLANPAKVQEDYKNSIISPELVIEANKEVIKYLEFDK